MKKLLLLILSGIVLSGVALSSAAFATDYTIDPDHSTIGFKIKHLAISSVTGRFTDVKGTLSYDAANPGASSVATTITINSITTENKKRDDHLRSPDFFDKDKFPEMKFASKEIKDATKDGFKLIGELTIRDVKKEVVLDVTNGGEAKDPWGNSRIAFAATTKLDRKDFGLTWNKALEAGGLLVSDEVTINLEIEAIKAKQS